MVVISKMIDCKLKFWHYSVLSCSSVGISFTWERLGQFSWSIQMQKNLSFKLHGKPLLQLLLFEFNATSGQLLSDCC